MAIETAEEFHSAIHGSVGTPSPGIRVIRRHKSPVRKKYDKMHTSKWANSSVNLKAKLVNTDVYIDFQRNSLSDVNFSRLKRLAIMGIQRYWSRGINLGGNQYKVNIRVHHRASNSIDVDLYVEESASYARSHNSGIVDASFFYNKGIFKGFNTKADQDFMLVAAHEFGHSVLEFFGGTDLSWGHKGSTTVLTQKVKSTSPGYPSLGEIDLMKYYDSTKNATYISPRSIYHRSIADEKDVKRLIWLSNITIK